MRLLLVTCLLIVGSLCARAEEEAAEKPEITKLEVVALGEGESDASDSDVQRKRDSGYSYKRPIAAAQRARYPSAPPGNRGRIVNRHPGQLNRPVSKYGPPGYQSPTARPASHSQQHRDKFPGHLAHQSNFNGRPGGLFEQEVPSPIRQVDFVEPNPISSQNNEPFAIHSANYLPPANQKLPDYAAPQRFTLTHAVQNQNTNQGHLNLQSQELLQSQDFVQPQAPLSDAALFLAQNAQAIQQLYGAPATEQDFAPNDSQFLGQSNQVSGQFQNFDSSSQAPQGFAGPLPPYASGTLSVQETLEQIQSLEKDRLIVQLQRALATQTQAAEAGRYAENQPGFVQNQDLLASLGQRVKIGPSAQPSTAPFSSTTFNQSPFLPGTTVSPGFPLSYGLTTTIRPSTTSTAATTSTTTTARPLQSAKGDTPSQAGSTVTPTSTTTTATGVPLYGGFVPTLIAAPGFVSNVPSYGPTFLAPGVAAVQPSGSAPTHFGLPIPVDSQKPAGTTPTVAPSSPTPSTPSTFKPSSPSTPTVATLPLHPVTSPLHPVVGSYHPVTSLQPVAPLQPVLPAAHPAQTPTYGFQPPLVSPFLVKPVKPVYPFYYYPNVPYQLHKPALPAYPWSYAPTYAPAKPAQIWK